MEKRSRKVKKNIDDVVLQIITIKWSLPRATDKKMQSESSKKFV